VDDCADLQAGELRNKGQPFDVIANTHSDEFEIK
jgi:hypothetical protein